MRAVFLLLILWGSASAAHLGRSLEEWRAQLGSENRVERLLAARALGEMAIAGERGAEKAVVESMGHEDPAVRYWGAVALGEMSSISRASRGRLQDGLSDDTPDVRVAAAQALINHGDARPVEVLIEVLGHSEATARLLAAHALDDIDDVAKPAVEALERAVEDEFDYVQRVARHALFELGERPCPYRQCE